MNCNICGGNKFSTGPNNRLSDTGLLPCCTQCGSLERHRSNRLLFQLFPLIFLKNISVLQFSPDPAIDPTWFKSHELSVYGGINSLDVQNINRESGSYDMVSLSHVLEFIPDDFAAISEIKRIISKNGLIHLVMSKPLSRHTSQDFEIATGYHQYYHLYGLDFDTRFSFSKNGYNIFVVKVQAPVTNVPEEVHFITKSTTISRIIETSLRCIPDCFVEYRLPYILNGS